MNLVSYSEDIEELKNENLHFMRGFNNLLDRLKHPPSLVDIEKTEKELKAFSSRLVAHFESIQERAKTQFEGALKLLHDPSVQITKRLEKRTKERNDARVALDECRSQLQTCRESQKRGLKKIEELSSEKRSLVAELEKLKDNAGWEAEVANTSRLKKK